MLSAGINANQQHTTALIPADMLCRECTCASPGTSTKKGAFQTGHCPPSERRVAVFVPPACTST
eukprot:3192630-Rhodomonas_salina.1